MGLDITAYKKFTITDHVPTQGTWCEEQDHVVPRLDTGFDQSFRGLPRDGLCVLTSGEQFNFRAGSYTGYGEWRRLLAYAAWDLPPEEVWTYPDRYRDHPFFELINFADDQGTIGPDAAADLAWDFDAHSNMVRPRLAQEDERATKRYDDWQRAFELAANHGLVRFH